MADFDLEAKITADASGYEAGVKKAEKASKKLSTSVSKVIQGLGKNGLVGALGAVGLASQGLTSTLGAVVKIARKVSETMNECTNAYKAQLIAERSLDTAIQNNPFVTGASADALKQFASEMQKVSNYGDEELIPMMANLVSLGRTETETMQIMSVAMDMSAGMGISLDSAITQLNATLNGNIGRLGQQNAELNDLTEEELRQGKAVEILGEKFKGLSSATVDTSKQLKNLKGDFKEAIGEFTLPSSDMWNKFWSGFYENGIKIINDLNKYLDTNIIGKNVASNFEKYYKSLKGNEKSENVQSYLWTLTDEELENLNSYLSGIKKLNEAQSVIYQQSQEEIERRKFLAELRAEEEGIVAKEKKEAEEIATKENEIIALKQKYIDKISEQETKWRNIETVTGEMVSNEEKLKYYQEQLVSIMTESGGKITQNNQYYKDQMAIINKLKEALGEVAEINAEIGEELEIKNAFEEIGEGISSAIKSIKTDWKKFGSDIVKIGTNSFGSMFEQLGEDLVNGEAGFENFANSAVKSIAEILKSLAAQLTALAAVNLATWQFGKAAIAAGAAAAALVAAGALSAVANNMNAINQATANANMSLEQFDAILQNIKETSFKSPSTLTKGFVESSKTLRKISENYKKARDEYNYWYEKLRAFNEQIGGLWGKEHIVDSLNAARDVYDLWASEITKVNRQVVDSFNEIVHQMEDVITNNSLTVESYKDYYFSFKKYQEAWRNWVLLSENERTKIKNDLNAMYQGLIRGDITENLYFQYQKYSDYVNMVRQELKAQVQELEISVYESFSSIGKNLGETLFNAIYDGISKESFMGNVKSYIRKMMLQITVYTESFSNTLSNIGTDLIQALFYGGTSSTALQRVKAKLSNYYDEVSAQVQGVEELLDSVFGKDLEKSVNEGINSLTRFEQALQSILDTISDLGGDIASQLVDGLSNGLSQSDFLDNMRKWVRNMMIQMVVYTDAMKGEIEAIGRRISEGVMTGFTDTDLHEIRRDLSYIFEEAASKVTNIDSLLGSVFGYANGTNNASSGLRLVGEAGPELVKFRGGEQVLNTRNTQKALANASGTTINQNVTFNNLQDTTAFAMMNQFKQYNRQMAINGVI